MSVPVTANFSRWALACAALIGVFAMDGKALAQGYPSQGYPAQVYPPSQAQQQQSANPMCGRLEAQLATIDRGNGLDPARADQIRRYEDSISRQQGELDRVTQQAKRMGCDSSGFFSLFSGQSAQCGPVNNQIQQMRGNLDQMTNSLERLRVGTPGSAERDNQRRSVLLALAQNQCGPQYAAAARQQQQNSGPGGFLSNLFGGNESSPSEMAPGGGDAMMTNVPQGTFRTVCVRTCDGFYFPISFTTVPGRFADDERACKAQCPATDANLYTYRNPGEDMNAAVSIAGQPYSSSPNAFKYRTEFNPSCSCKAQGQSWADALKTIDDSSAAQNGDITVTEERAKRMSQPKGTPASLKKNATPDAPAQAQQPAATPSAPGQIRQVGPQFLPNNTKQ